MKGFTNYDLSHWGQLFRNKVYFSSGWQMKNPNQIQQNAQEKGEQTHISMPIIDVK